MSARPAARWPAWAVPAALVLLALAALAFAHGYWAFRVTMLLVYALAIRSLQLLVNGSGQISLGHGAFFALGAYAAGILMAKQGLPTDLAVPLAGLACGVLGWLFGRPAVRLAGPYLALATFALALALPQLLKHPLLESWTGGVSGLSFDPPAVPAWLPGLDADRVVLLRSLLWTAAAFWLLHRLVAGPAGVAWNALRDQPTAAAAVGVDVPAWKSAAFAVAAAAVGIAGALHTTATHFVSPDSFTVLLSLYMLVGVAIAGPTSAVGTFVGALFLVLVPDLTEKLSRELTGLFFGALMLGSVYLLPVVRRRLGGRA